MNTHCSDPGFSVRGKSIDRCEYNKLRLQTNTDERNNIMSEANLLLHFEQNCGEKYYKKFHGNE